MIWRIGGTAAAIVPIAAQALAQGGATVATSSPVLVHPLGYTVELASLIAALGACVAVRFYVVSQSKEHRWTVEVPIMALALMFTAAMIAKQRPEPLMALFIGTAFGAVGAGIIAIAKRYLDRLLGPLVGDDPPTT